MLPERSRSSCCAKSQRGWGHDLCRPPRDPWRIAPPPRMRRVPCPPIGIFCTCSVVGSYWISSIMSVRRMTLPFVVARFLPTSKASGSALRTWPCIGGDVVEEIREAFGQVGAAALKRLSQDCRVCRREVRGRNGVDETLRKELNLLPRWSRQVRLVADQFPQPLGSYQVIVLEQIERDVFIPFLILEAAGRCA